MAQKQDKLAALRSAIGQQLTHQPPKPAPDAAARASRPAAEPPKTARPRRAKAVHHETGPAERTGKGVQFYLDDVDRKLINQLAVWFASQDRRVSDSQVIKVLIRAIKPNSELLVVCDTVRQSDRRREKRKK